MTCPDCDGLGRVRKRFLLFFKRWARCRKCLGTGVFPPPAVVRGVPPLRDDDDDDDDRGAWAARAYGAGTIAGRDWTPRDADPPPADERFEVGSGGRSGGGGATASWGDGGDSAPVIVDPFASEAGATGSAIAAEGAIVAEAADTARDDSSSGGSSSDTGDSASADSGTSY